jgi:RNA polymerase sigma-70 factor (ECF subfamily)
MTGDAHAAEDVVQETFLTVFRKIATLSDDRSFRSWFFAILMNRCREHRRAQKPRTMATLVEEAKSGPDPGTVADDALSRAVDRLVSELPEFEQMIFQSVIVDRTPYETVAGLHRVSLEVVRTRVYRLRKRLCELVSRMRREGGVM